MSSKPIYNRLTHIKMYDTKPIPQYQHRKPQLFTLHGYKPHNIKHGPDQLDVKEHANKTKFLPEKRMHKIV